MIYKYIYISDRWPRGISFDVGEVLYNARMYGGAGIYTLENKSKISVAGLTYVIGKI